MKAFVDTNVLIYAYDRQAGSKHERARQLVEELWRDGRGALSTQVLQEFYVNVRRKSGQPISEEICRALIADYLAWEPIVNDGAAVLEAIDVGRRSRIPFWDALIVVAAIKSGASILYSEDFNHGQKFSSVQILNPFIEPSQ